ncbi:MAG: cytidylyltransferase domain-containing protein [Candidatus Thorarchaeota archaeon]
MTSKTIAIIQARMGSSRFPGKSLVNIGDWSLIELVLKRVKQSSKIDHVVLATSVNPSDDVLESNARQMGFSVSRGSEEDVLSRFIHAAKSFNPTIVVRITGDCPLISPRLIDDAIDCFLEKNVDYLALSIGNDKDRAYPRGFDVEVAKFTSLSEAGEKATEKFEREHVMPYLYTHGDLYSFYILEPESEVSRPNYRLCVDTKQDLEMIKQLHEHFQDRLIDVEFLEIIQYLDRNPEIVMINQSVEQKHFTETDSRIGQ